MYIAICDHVKRFRFGDHHNSCLKHHHDQIFVQATSSLESHGSVKSQSILRQSVAPSDNEAVGASVGTPYSDRLGEPAEPSAAKSAAILDLDMLDHEVKYEK